MQEITFLQKKLDASRYVLKLFNATELPTSERGREYRAGDTEEVRSGKSKKEKTEGGSKEGNSISSSTRLTN